MRSDWEGPSRRRFLWLLTGAAGSAWAGPLQSSGGEDAIVVAPVPFAGEPVVGAFNAASNLPRIIGIFSPTCAHCLQTCADLGEELARHPDFPMEVLLLWGPFEPDANVGKARSAAEYLRDSRVRHYWDLWRWGARTFSSALRLAPENAWGVLLFFDPGTAWAEPAPRYSAWLQSRNLKVGTPFSRKALQKRLEPWLKAASPR